MRLSVKIFLLITLICKPIPSIRKTLVVPTALWLQLKIRAAIYLIRNVHDQLFFIPGVERSQVKSLFSPSTRFTEVVEDGFAGGPVIPADFSNDEYGLKVVRDNIEKAGIVGRLIGNDYTSAMVSAQLMEFDPQTGEAIDTIAFANQLEQELRGKFETENSYHWLC